MAVIISAPEDFPDSGDVVEVDGLCEILFSRAQATDARQTKELEFEIMLSFKEDKAEVALQSGGCWVSKNVLNSGRLLKLDTESQQHFLLQITGVRRLLVKTPSGFYAWISRDNKPYNTPILTIS